MKELSESIKLFVSIAFSGSSTLKRAPVHGRFGIYANSGVT